MNTEQPVPIPDSIQDALAVLLEEQFALGMFAAKHGQHSVTPNVAKRSAVALRGVTDSIRAALSASKEQSR